MFFLYLVAAVSIAVATQVVLVSVGVNLVLSWIVAGVIGMVFRDIYEELKG